MKWEVRVAYKRGVQDPEGETTLEALRMLGFKGVKRVSTAKLFVIEGECTREEVERMCRRLLANPVSQDYEIRRLAP